MFKYEEVCVHSLYFNNNFTSGSTHTNCRALPLVGKGERWITSLETLAATRCYFFYSVLIGNLKNVMGNLRNLKNVMGNLRNLESVTENVLGTLSILILFAFCSVSLSSGHLFLSSSVFLYTLLSFSLIHLPVFHLKVHP